MVTDEPRFHQWVIFEGALFKKHPVRNPTYGMVSSVKRINRQDIFRYYKKVYNSKNIIISVVGDVRDPAEKIEAAFGRVKRGEAMKALKIKEPLQKRIQRKTETRNVLNSYVVMGYKTTDRGDRDSYTLDVIHAILGKGQSGKLFHEIRTKLGLAYEIGVHSESASDYGFFSVYFNTDKKKIKRVVKIILNELQNLKNTSEQELFEAKTSIEGSYLLQEEDTHRMADEFASWEQVSKAKDAERYISRINKVTLRDIRQVAEKYFTKYYTLAVIQQKEKK